MVDRRRANVDARLVRLAAVVLVFGLSVLGPRGSAFGASGSCSSSGLDARASFSDGPFNGDGVADRVLRQSADAGVTPGLFVQKNEVTGRANLLSVVHRPLGGTIALDYDRTPNSVAMPQSRQVLTRVVEDDGVDVTGVPSPALDTTYEYEGGYFDRGEKEFFGFRTVTVHRQDGATIERQYVNDDYALKGRLRSETLRDVSGAVFTRVVNDHDVRAEHIAAPAEPCVVTRHPLLPSTACDSVFPFVRQVTTTSCEGGVVPTDCKSRTERDVAYDAFGNLVESEDQGDDTTADDNVYARATYTDDVSRWIVGLPRTL
ncbi:MAG: toxin TcdB middle/N-terminal domain-containing protein, partial [Acidobacteriota bacterium]